MMERFVSEDVYSLRIVGVSHYQEALGQCRVGEPVRFVHEPDNPYDHMALRVTNDDGETLGYVPKRSWLRAVIHERGRGVAGAIASIGMSRSCLIGAVVSVAITDDDVRVASYYPDQAPPEPPRGGFRYWVLPVSASAQGPRAKV